MARKHMVLLVAFSIGGTAPLLASGCVVTTRGAVVVDSPPPRARVEVVQARPGYVWVDGYWANRGGRWVWRGGYWQPERAGYVYVQGRWLNRGGRWHWVEPRWDRGRGQARRGGRARGTMRPVPPRARDRRLNERRDRP
jgi:hypothetical protein